MDKIKEYEQKISETTVAIASLYKSDVDPRIIRFLVASDFSPLSISLISEVILEIRNEVSDKDILHRLAVIRSGDMTKIQLQNILIGNWD